MFLIRTRIRYQGPIAAMMRSKRAFNQQVLRPAWWDVGLHWKQQFWAKHFTKAGAAEYDYAPRKGEKRARGSRAYQRSYTGRKESDFGHTDPLVYTGELKRETRNSEVRPSSKGVKIVMRARKANWRHPKSEVRMADELREVSSPEERKLARELDRGMIRAIRSIRDTYTRTV